MAAEGLSCSAGPGGEGTMGEGWAGEGRQEGLLVSMASLPMGAWVGRWGGGEWEPEGK